MKRIYISIVVLLALCGGLFADSYWQPTQPPKSYVRNRLSIYSVKDYGAKGDSATDDRAAIQSAIHACADAGGGTVWFPLGTYRIGTDAGVDSNLYIKPGSENVRIIGYGSRLVTNISLFGGGLIGVLGDSLTLCKNILIEGLTIHDYSAGKMSGNNAIWAVWSDGVIVKNCRIERASHKGIVTHWVKNVWFDNNIVDSAWFAGIVIEPGSWHVATSQIGSRRAWVTNNYVGWVDTDYPGGDDDSLMTFSPTLSVGCGISLTAGSISLWDSLVGVIVANNYVGHVANAEIHTYGIASGLIYGNMIDTLTQSFDVGGLGQLRLHSNEVDDSRDSISIIMKHYDWDEEDITIIRGWGTDGNSKLLIGGGAEEYNSVEHIEFYTGDGDHVSLVGTMRLKIDSVEAKIIGNARVVGWGYFSQAGNDTNFIEIFHDGDDAYLNTDKGNLKFQVGGVSKLTIDSTTGSVIIGLVKYPVADGTTDYFLQTDGAGQASWAAGAGGGTSDSTGVDTDGDGTVDAYTYPSFIKKGANVTLTVSGDTLIIAGPAGSGTADSAGIDTDGDGTVDSYLYSTVAGAFHIKKGSNITLTVDNDTVTIAAAAGSGFWAFRDSTTIVHVNDSTGDTVVFVQDTTQFQGLRVSGVIDVSNWIATPSLYGDEVGSYKIRIFDTVVFSSSNVRPSYSPNQTYYLDSSFITMEHIKKLISDSVAGGNGLWTENGDTTLRIDGDGDTIAIMFDDDGVSPNGLVIWRVGTEDQKLYILADTLNLLGELILTDANITMIGSETVDGVDVSVLNTILATDSGSWNATADALGTAIDSTKITNASVSEADMTISNSPTDEYVMTWEADAGTGGQITWEAQAGGNGLTYWTEGDDNDTSLFTATGPNTWVGLNDNLTMQGNDITGVGNFTVATSITVPDNSISDEELDEGSDFTWSGNHSFQGTGFSLVDGVGDSPVMVFADEESDYLNISKLDLGGALFFNSEGEFQFKFSNDQDDYIYFDTFAANVPMISTVGACDLVITSSSGYVSFDTAALIVNGDTIGDFTGTNLSVTDGVLNAAGGNGLWVASGDTLFLVDATSDTLAAFWDDNAGNVRWQVGTEDQTLHLFVDTVGIGKANPDEILHLFGNNATLKFEDDSENKATINVGNSQLCIQIDPDDLVESSDICFDIDGNEIARFHASTNFGIGTLSPPERLSVVGNIATGDTAAGDVDVYHYFSTNGSYATEYFKWDDGLGRFELSDDFYVGGNISLTGSITGYFDTAAVVDTAQALDNIVLSKIRDTVMVVLDTIWFGMTIDNPDGLTKDSVMVLAVDAEWAPNGITLLSVGIKTWAATTYSVDFIEFTEPGDGGAESSIETVATSSSREAEDDGTLTDADIAAGSIVVVDLPTTDIDQVMVWGTFTID